MSFDFLYELKEYKVGIRNIIFHYYKLVFLEKSLELNWLFVKLDILCKHLQMISFYFYC